MNSTLHHRQVKVDHLAIHLVEGGKPDGPPVVLLHGYPENWMAFEQLMSCLEEKYRVIAIDLPEIGLSRGTVAGDKKALAALIDQLLRQLQLEKVTLVGHDIGGMITYAVLRHFPEHLSSAVVIGTAIPGLAPWEEVKRNPYIWHFAFYAVPQLPEILTAGRIKPLFDYFFNTLCFNKKAIPDSRRGQYVEAYERPMALSTSFNWYRAFPQDEKDNADPAATAIPLLYIRGDHDYGSIDDYANGLRQNGIQDLSVKLVSGSGHFIPEENADELARTIDHFITQTGV